MCWEKNESWLYWIFISMKMEYLSISLFNFIHRNIVVFLIDNFLDLYLFLFYANLNGNMFNFKFHLFNVGILGLIFVQIYINIFFLIPLPSIYILVSDLWYSFIPCNLIMIILKNIKFCHIKFIMSELNTIMFIFQIYQFVNSAFTLYTHFLDIPSIINLKIL